MNGRIPSSKKPSGRAIAQGDGLGLDDRVDLRHLLAGDDVDRRDDHVGDARPRSPTAVPCERRRRTAARASVAIAGSPRKPMPSEASVMPNWQADRYWLRSSMLAQRRAPRRACRRGLLLEPRAAGAHERELGRDEEPVDAERAATPRRCSSAVIRRAAREPLLRGRSSGTLDSPRRELAADAGASGEARRSARRGRGRPRVTPPSRWVDSVSRTLFQPWTRMSGWWFGVLGRAARRGSTSAIAAAKSASSTSRTIAPSPAPRGAPRRASISSCARSAMPTSLPGGHVPCRSSSPMRIVSLVPHATELLFALGLGDDVVGVTHECDYPPRPRDAAARHARRAAARASTPRRSTPPCGSAPRRGEAIYAPRRASCCTSSSPTSSSPRSCARSAPSRYDDVRAVAAGSRRCPKVIALDPKTFGETMGDIRTIAQATGTRDAALDLVARQRARVDRVRLAVRGAPRRPRRRARVARPGLRRRPLDAAAHRAGRRHRRARLRRASTPSRRPGTRSPPPQPEVVVAMPCGYDAARSLAEATTTPASCARARRAARRRDRRLGHFSRPGPRLVDGLEMLAHVLHPDRVAVPAGVAPALDVALPAADGGAGPPPGPLGRPTARPPPRRRPAPTQAAA